MKIGFIGQGWIGRHYADDFETRGYTVVRYALEEPYVKNKKDIADCDIVFIAVPTPTTPDGFDDSAVQNAVSCVGKGKIAVIKSTMIPGATKKVQENNPHQYVFHSPEFLREASAAHDASNPERNIIGIPLQSDKYHTKAEEVLGILPEAPFHLVCDSTEAELVKYAGNCFLFTKVVFMNLLYDLSRSVHADFDTVRSAVVADPRIGSSHMNPVHTSGHGGVPGRGAGGHCFIKDFSAFTRFYEKEMAEVDDAGIAVLKTLEAKNKRLLRQSEKDLDLLKQVYGKET